MNALPAQGKRNKNMLFKVEGYASAKPYTRVPWSQFYTIIGLSFLSHSVIFILRNT
jgi:hypothetical protein